MKVMKLYHATSLENAKKIREKGIDSHSWFATRKQRAKVYGTLNEQMGKGKHEILEFRIPESEVEKRELVKQSSPDTGCEYMLNSYRLKKLKPIN